MFFLALQVVSETYFKATVTVNLKVDYIIRMRLGLQGTMVVEWLMLPPHSQKVGLFYVEFAGSFVLAWGELLCLHENIH